MRNFLLFSLAIFLTSCGGQTYNPKNDTLSDHSKANVKIYVNNDTKKWGMSYGDKEVLLRQYDGMTNQGTIDLPQIPLVCLFRHVGDDYLTTVAIGETIFRKDIKGYISANKYTRRYNTYSNDFFSLDNIIVVSGDYHQRYVNGKYGKKYLGRDLDVFILVFLDDQIILSFDNDGDGHNTLKEVYSYDEYSFKLTQITDEKVIKEYDNKVKNASPKRVFG